MEVLRQIYTFNGTVTHLTPFICALIVLPFCFQFVNENFYVRFERWFSDRGTVTQGLVIGFILTILSGVSPEGVAPFIYFQF